MNCRRISNLLSAYMDGELTGVEMLEIRRHLDECLSCSVEHEELRQAKQLLAHLSYAAPRADFAESICATLDCIRVPRYQRMFNRILVIGRGRLTPVAAGCVGVAGVMMLLIAQPVSGPTTIASDIQPHRAEFASAIGMQSASDTMQPVAYFASTSSEPHPYIPAQPSDEASNGSAYMLTASFVGR